MSHTKHLYELISMFATYEQSHKHVDVNGFLNWATQQRQTATAIKMGTSDAYANTRVEDAEVSISILLTMLTKYARNYSKAAMHALPIHTPEEFGYLARLSSYSEMPKTELATSGMEGKTTGMEIINRLIAYELIKEKDNPDDKRSKLVHLTAKGRKILAESYIRMGKVAKYVSADLTASEKQTLKTILLKLEAYHKLNEAEVITLLSK